MSNPFWTSCVELQSFLWGVDQWTALQAGQPIECSQIRCTFDEVDPALVANRTLCLRRGAEHSMVRLFHQEQPLGVIDIRFRLPEESYRDDLATPSPPPFSTCDDEFTSEFPHLSSRWAHPHSADLRQIAKTIAEHNGTIGQLEISSHGGDHQNADLRTGGGQLTASLWRAGSQQRWVA